MKKNFHEAKHKVKQLMTNKYVFCYLRPCKLPYSTITRNKPLKICHAQLIILLKA